MSSQLESPLSLSLLLESLLLELLLLLESLLLESLVSESLACSDCVFRCMRYKHRTEAA